MAATSIDLNADLGEGFGVWTLGDDDALLDIVTSANIACGFHGGDAVTMRRVCAGAAARGVAIGAQVGYRDLAGFGRRALDIASADLVADIVYQVAALDGFARIAGSRVSYVKPHGALYNTASVDPRQAAAVVDAIGLIDRTLPVLGLPGSALERAAGDAGLPFVAEAFADRAYSADGRLVSRSEPGALITDTTAVVAQALSIVRTGSVQALDGSWVAVRAESLCLHSDTPGAVEHARRVRAALTDAAVRIAPFAN